MLARTMATLLQHYVTKRKLAFEVDWLGKKDNVLILKPLNHINVQEWCRVRCRCPSHGAPMPCSHAISGAAQGPVLLLRP